MAEGRWIRLILLLSKSIFWLVKKKTWRNNHVLASCHCNKSWQRIIEVILFIIIWKLGSVYTVKSSFRSHIGGKLSLLPFFRGWGNVAWTTRVAWMAHVTFTWTPLWDTQVRIWISFEDGHRAPFEDYLIEKGFYGACYADCVASKLTHVWRYERRTDRKQLVIRCLVILGVDRRMSRDSARRFSWRDADHVQDFSQWVNKVENTSRSQRQCFIWINLFTFWKDLFLRHSEEIAMANRHWADLQR